MLRSAAVAPAALLKLARGTMRAVTASTRVDLPEPMSPAQMCLYFRRDAPSSVLWVVNDAIKTTL
jgi:hypothetical protein